jgi:hypothetical protein
METIPVIYLSGALRVFRTRNDGNTHLKHKRTRDSLIPFQLLYCPFRSAPSGVRVKHSRRADYPTGSRGKVRIIYTSPGFMFRLSTGIVGSNRARGMDISAHLL